MISIKRMKDSTKERLIGLIDKNELFAVERSVFEPSWKVAHYSKLPNDIVKLKEYAKCMNDNILPLNILDDCPNRIDGLFRSVWFPGIYDINAPLIHSSWAWVIREGATKA